MTADEILRSFDFYRLATPERRAECAAAVSTVSLPEGATFYREGDMCPQLPSSGALTSACSGRLLAGARSRCITCVTVNRVSSTC